MNKERLQEIKDSIDLQLTVAKSIGTTNELAEEEKELYDEVVRLGNVINELEKWLKGREQHFLIDDCQKEVVYEFKRISTEYTKILDKLKELKEGK